MPWGEECMATDRDEQLRQQRELEEIRRSFAEMGARMGSLFEPPEPDEDDQSERAGTAGEPAPAPAATQGSKALAIPTAQPAPPTSGSAVSTWPRWWLAGAVVLLLLAGTALGYLLPRGDGADGATAAPPRVTTPATPAPTTTPSTAQTEPRTSVPEVCLDTAELGDEVIARLNRNIRDERLFLALRDYTVASQACRKEASR
jgi:hypothetical protein